MKKLKIFLLISILLCFGFVLSPEVHAQGNGPKAFEVGDVLPQGLVKITGKFYSAGEIFIRLNSVYFISKSEDCDDFRFESSFDSYLVEDNTNYSTGTIDAIFDFSSLSESERTFNTGYYDGGNVVYWEEYIAGYSVTFEENGGTSVTDLTNQTALPNPLPIPSKENHTFLGWYYDSDFTNEALANDPLTGDITLYAKWELVKKIFEEGDVLPAGYIKISWDFTGYPMAVDGDFLISSDGDFSIRIWEFDNITLFINDEMFYADTPGNTIITLTESVTITDMDGYDDYYEYIHGALLWEVISQDYLDGFMEARELYGFEMGGYWISGEQAWNNGYDLGSELAWEEGFEYGMDIYGYYDPITDQWLSVSGYLELYGTDKPGQSDFYGNFDKYFIPAMIIVFGGAIVLTILKVFKGRE